MLLYSHTSYRLYHNGIVVFWEIWKRSNIKKGVLLSGYINPMHTSVPGPDGKFGYGGKCFPKDVDALAKMCKDLPIHRLLKELKELNVSFRGEEK